MPGPVPTTRRQGVDRGAGQGPGAALLGPIFTYEQSQHGDLIVTLRTYLDTQRSWQKTAAALFTHRQTVMYRIRKISELTGLDMTETSTLAQFWFALQIHEAMHN
jgi:purine catabolism regulator